MDNSLVEASESLGVRQVAECLYEDIDLRAAVRIAPHNLVIEEDNRSWCDNGSILRGSVADLISVLQGCSPTEAAEDWLTLIRDSSSDFRRSISPEAADGGIFHADAPFPVECLPQLLRDMVAAIAEMENVPPVLAACAVIGAASACLGRGIALESKNDKIAPGNLFIVLEAASGSGKSGVTERANVPLSKFEQELKEKHRKSLSRVTSRLIVVEAQLKSEYAKVGRDGTPHSQEEVGKLATLEDEKSVLERQIEPPTLLIGDTTTERLIQLVNINGAVASLTGEGRGAVQVLCGYYSKGIPNDSFYLSSFTVFEESRQNRVERGDLAVAVPCLVIMWMLQPDAFQKLWTNKSLSDGGFLARCLPCRTHARPQPITAERKTFPAGLAERYEQRLRELLENYRMNVGSPLITKAFDQARQVIVDFTNRTTERRNNGELSKRADTFASRWGEQAWRMALVFHAVQHGALAHTIDVSASTARNAVAVVSWFTLQQLELLNDQEGNDGDSQRLKITEMVARSRRVTARMVHKAGVGESTAEARAILEEMVKEGLLESSDHRGRGTPTRHYHFPTARQRP